MKLPRNFTSRSFAVVGFSVALYGAAALIFGWDDVLLRLESFPPELLLPLAGLSLVNYTLRFWRWQIYLRALGIPLAFRPSMNLYFATYVMVITPGKIGEVFKAGILRERFDVPLAKGLPVVLAERIYDFLAVFILAVVGVFFWPGKLTGLTTGLLLSAAVPFFLLILRHPGLRAKLVDRAARSSLLARYQVGLDDSLKALAILLGLRISIGSVVLTTAAWFAECLGLWLVCRGLGFAVPVGEATFVYAAGTLVGSLTFLPGGLGGTEATIIWLLGILGMPAVQGAAAALLIRMFTLWLAVIIGLIFFAAARRDLFSEPKETTRP